MTKPAPRRKRTGPAAAAPDTAVPWTWSAIVGACWLAVYLLLALAILGALLLKRRMSALIVPCALAGACVPLAGYSFIYFRAVHPAAFQWPPLQPSLASVVRHITGGGYGSYFGHFAPAPIQRELLAQGIYPFVFPGLALLAFGIVRTRRTLDRVLLGGLALAGGLQTVLGFFYGVPDPASYFLPALVVALLALPILAAAFPSRLWAAFVLVAASLPFELLALSWLSAASGRRAGFAIFDAHLHGLWRGLPAERAIVLWPDDMYCKLREYQIFFREQPEIYVNNPNFLTYDGPRAAFEHRFGFDPLAGTGFPGPMDLATIPANVARQTPLPVYTLDHLGIAFERLERGRAAP